ncbi:MAG: HEAT repeat domain-containing protein [Verrucomicrobiota bacterium]
MGFHNERKLGTAGKREEARTVVRVLGTNSVPLLLDWLRQEDKVSLKERYNTWHAKIITTLQKYGIVKNPTITYLQVNNPSHRAMAMYALPELDHAAKQTAIPALIQMLAEKELKTGEVTVTAGVAGMTLAKMTPESIAPLTTALSSKDHQTRLLAAWALGEIGPDARTAIPFLKSGLDDKDPLVRVTFAEAIGKLGAEPSLFLPTIVRALPVLSNDSLSHALEVLGQYKEHAKGAVPVLMEILSTKTQHATNLNEAYICSDLTNTIQRIDGSVLSPLMLDEAK